MVTLVHWYTIYVVNFSTSKICIPLEQCHTTTSILHICLQYIEKSSQFDHHFVFALVARREVIAFCYHGNLQAAKK